MADRTVAIAFAPPNALVEVQLSASTWATKNADGSGYASYNNVSDDLGDSTVRITADGYKPYVQHVKWKNNRDNANEPKPLNHQIDVGIDIPPLTPAALPVPSKLHVEDRDFVTAQGERYLLVGSSELMLARRYDLEGPDAIRSVLEQRKTLGFNNLRVLLQKDIRNTGSSPWQFPVEKLRDLLALVGGYGFYLQGTILADCQVVNHSVTDQQARVNAVREATVGVDNLIEQLGNEYEKNDHDPHNFSKPDDRLAANSSSVEGGKDAPYWDFFCFSGQRTPLSHAIREYGPIEFMYANGQPWGGVPAICDEGFKPGMQSFDSRDWERAGAQGRSGCGARFHSLMGTSYEVGLFTPLEYACAEAFVRGLKG